MVKRGAQTLQLVLGLDSETSKTEANPNEWSNDGLGLESRHWAQIARLLELSQIQPKGQTMGSDSSTGTRPRPKKFQNLAKYDRMVKGWAQVHQLALGLDSETFHN